MYPKEQSHLREGIVMRNTSTPQPPKRYTVTAALPYANGPLHIGHLAGAHLPADIYVRYLRSQHKDVLFISGSDEHGVPIAIRAAEASATPRQIADRYHRLNQASLHHMGIHFDVFTRTSSQAHRRNATEFFEELHRKGIFEKRSSAQYYDGIKQQFLADRYIRGRCPHCAHEDAYGDQCESCGTSLEATELLEPRSSLSNTPPELRETTHWYLPLNRYAEWLRTWLLEEQADWKPNVRAQCKAWLDQGLRPRAITRDLDWGVPVPLKEAKNKVLYVWFEAPIGYITATQEWAEKHHKNWKDYWSSPTTRLVHFIGKDNIVFHCIIFPTLLKAHGNFILPSNVPANDFLNLEGRKISTSRGWAVWVDDYLASFPNQQDALRYVLCANGPENRDSDFSWRDFQARNNNELVAVLGNFVHRVLTLIQKHYGGIVPEANPPGPAETALSDQVKQSRVFVGRALDQYRFKEALQEVMQVARSANKYLTEKSPWTLLKTDKVQAGGVLCAALQLMAHLAALLSPFLPFSTEKMYKMLCIDALPWTPDEGVQLVPSGTQLPVPERLFVYIPDDLIAHQRSKLSIQR